MNYLIKCCCVVFLIFLNVFLSNGQTQPLFDKIDKTDGLSNNRVTCIVRDPDGFVWIGTINGLNRYDGKTIKVYTKQNSNIGSNDIADITIDSKGRIWVVSRNGVLNLYDEKHDDLLAFENITENNHSVSLNKCNVIFEDFQGNLWLGTENGLSFFEETTKTFTTYTHRNSDINTISHNHVSSIYQTKKGSLWVGTFGGGLNKFDIQTHQFIRINPAEASIPNYIRAISKLDNKRLLVGTDRYGLQVFDMQTFRFKNYLRDVLKSNIDVNIVRSIMKDSRRNIWVGTDGNGIIKIEDLDKKMPAIYNYTHDNKLQHSISGNAIYDIEEDDEGNIWVGMAWFGVNILSQQNNYDFFFSDITGENPVAVLSIYKEKEAFLLGLDGNGLTIFNPKLDEIKLFNRERNFFMGGHFIQHITKAGDNLYWLGTFSNGLIRFNKKTGTYLNYKYSNDDSESLSYNDVRYVLPDENNNLWVATWGGGLNHFNTKTGTFTSYREDKKDSLSINSDNIISIQKDKDKLWLGTYGGGVELFDPKTGVFTHHIHDNNNLSSLSNNDVFCLLKDSRGNLWVGTLEGINMYNRNTKQFERFDENRNVSSQSVMAIAEDNEGLIWFSTKQGIFNYNYSLNKFSAVPELVGDYHINSVFKGNDGLLYFGGIKGVVSFNPDSIPSKREYPKVKITNFKLFNKEVPIGKNDILKSHISLACKVVLKHNLDVITFEFAALDFPFSSNCEYAIKMENFDKDWRTIGKNRTATYTNLPSGAYTFKVKSTKARGDWGSEYTSVDIEIRKPFWLEWWAFVVYGLLTFISLYLFRKYIVAWERMKSKLKLEKITHEKETHFYSMKQQFFTNISHEIRTPLTLIFGAANRLIKNKEEFEEEHLNSVYTIKKNSSSLFSLVNELLDLRKLEQKDIKLKVTENDWVQFCEEIYLSFTEIALNKNIELAFDTTISDINLWFDKNQMEKVLYNLLSNAIKFTLAGGYVSMKIQETNQGVQLIVEDCGDGISKENISKVFKRFYQSEDSEMIGTGYGLGLSISKEIINLHHGNIQVKSREGEGTVFTITLLKGKVHFNKGEYFAYKDVEIDEPELTHTSKPFLEITKGTEELKKQTILIVEDNEDMRKYIAELLLGKCTLLEAVNGSCAFDMALDKLPDLIISDIMMPIMDGITLTKKLKTNINTSHIPVVLLTAKASVAHKVEGYDSGADDYIVKPFDETLFYSKVNGILRNRVLFRERFSKNTLLLPDNLDITQTDQEFLMKLTVLIQDNIDSDELNINFIAQELGMSHSVIYKKIKALTGMSIVEFIRDFKLKVFKKLIEEQNFSIADACYYVGYSDRKYFSKLFKQKFGVSPSSFCMKKRI